MSLVNNLENLKKERSEALPFDDLLEFENWADEVLPLLRFSTSLFSRFNSCITSAKVTHRMGNHVDSATNMNEAIGILNQAITEAQREDQAIEFKELAYPDKVTVRWLLNHVEVKHWLLAVSILASAFVAGVSVGQSEIYHNFFSEIKGASK